MLTPEQMHESANQHLARADRETLEIIRNGIANLEKPGAADQCLAALTDMTLGCPEGYAILLMQTPVRILQMLQHGSTMEKLMAHLISLGLIQTADHIIKRIDLELERRDG